MSLIYSLLPFKVTHQNTLQILEQFPSTILSEEQRVTYSTLPTTTSHTFNSVATTNHQSQSVDVFLYLPSTCLYTTYIYIIIKNIRKTIQHNHYSLFPHMLRSTSKLFTIHHHTLLFIFRSSRRPTKVPASTLYYKYTHHTHPISHTTPLVKANTQHPNFMHKLSTTRVPRSTGDIYSNYIKGRRNTHNIQDEKINHPVSPPMFTSTASTQSTYKNIYTSPNFTNTVQSLELNSRKIIITTQSPVSKDTNNNNNTWVIVLSTFTGVIVCTLVSIIVWYIYTRKCYQYNDDSTNRHVYINPSYRFLLADSFNTETDV